MKTLTGVAAALLAAAWISALASATASPWQAATLAWDRGDYVTALTDYLRLLDSADGAGAFEPIALQTGELYRTVELTADGVAPRFSPDGRHVLYETGQGLTRVTRVLPADGSTQAVADLRGTGAVFSPDGSKLAYLRITVTPDLTALQTALAQASPDVRARQLAALNLGIAAATTIALHDLTTGRESAVNTGTLRASALAVAASGAILFAGAPPDGSPTQIYAATAAGPPTALTAGDGDKTPLEINASGTALILTIRPAGGGRGGPGRAGGARGGGPGGPAAQFGVLSIPDGRLTTLTGSAPSFSGDGRSLVYVARDGNDTRVTVASAGEPSTGMIVRHGPERVDAPALSRDGSRVAFQMMTKDDWDIYVVNRDGTGESRVTREIQHDVVPRFVTADRLLGAIGEARHRRSYLYDLPSMTRTRLFHNNTIRTIAPEYSWTTSADGTKVLISAERDGDTVSPERGIYLVDLSARITRDQLRARLRTSLAAEQALRAKGQRMYGPIAAAVRQVVSDASVARVYGYEKALFDFDSKHISQPGNKLAASFLFDTYRSFGYEPAYQTFEPRGALGGQSSNVLATLKGTVNPELVYVVSSHYDSVAIGPGADDDSSGTAALLETARIMAGHPQPATIIFASFTGEEAGLLGSREFVRRAVADKLKLVGALNNDMIGWANDHRLDNTIRYSNAGIRDVQHAAAMQFTNMVTYDALYYKSTDAAAYYEAYGDIVGGIGSYPVLGNPHYHQSHDLLESINHQLVTEVSKTTAATLMLLASSPSRLTDLRIDAFKTGAATLSWTASPEAGVTGYIVAYGPPSKPEAQLVRAVKPSVTLTGVAPGTIVAVKAVNAKGMEGWDWARVVVK